MAFTQPCFIRKNTPELREKLRELRYIISDALAASRDDNDYMQWFISDETKQFYKCTSNEFDFHQEGIANWLCCSSAEYFRKATVEEIIDRFK